MHYLKHILILIIALSFFSFVTPEDKYVRQALKQLEKGNLREAKALYLKAIERDPESFNANVGMGLLLSELLDNHADALPYLEKAYKVTKKDTLGQLIYSLAKCYQHNGEFEKAITMFDRLNNYEDYEEEIDLAKDIKKRKDDCNYALQHKTYTASTQWYIVNAGKNINTDMPEYVPVLTQQNELIFTSRRQDDKKEQLSYLDGKYFESMYITKIDANGFKDLRPYTLPDQLVKSHYLKKHESVVSMSPDGKTLFTFRDNKIYEINMDQRKTQKPKKLLKTVNFDFYQSHAFLTKDGNTLYFTSEANEGLGGIDIYRATKIKEGEWSKPENLGATINTSFDEDAPFVSEDGKTLYFSSTGHEGFGNFDIYKSEFVDGKWSAPENLGQPINSPGHDIFMVRSNDESVAYFSSSRSGGFGDMDIYKINYLNNLNKECPTQKTEQFALNIIDEDLTDLKNKIEVKVPANYKVLSYEWKVNENPITDQLAVLNYDYKQNGNYTVSSKVIVYCDTCLSPLVVCNSIENKFEKVKVDTSTVITATTAVISAVDLNTLKGELNVEQLQALGFNTNPILFDFDKSNLTVDAEEILKTNNEVLKKHPGLKIEIIGYADSRGTEQHNKALSSQRANAVKNYLAKAKVKSSQLKFSTGKGASNLVNDCGKGKDCDNYMHLQNRRVIFKVYNK
ncbi:MAG: PD40 domain-containing protein [Bacteroidetes bacterium]|nr:PD40 domain-containing protein [Bacteroidota bacterium]